MRSGLRALALTLGLGAALTTTLVAPAARAQTGDDVVLQAREALRKKDRNQLTAARQLVTGIGHPLAQWVEYWELSNRLAEAQQTDLDAFYARWSGSYVEDRLRNDWLLELGKRRDWAGVRAEFPRFRMNDDREVTCYALLAQHLDGQAVAAAAVRAAWHAQRELDDGCALMAATLAEARVLGPDDLWQRARLAIEFNRPRLARAALTLAGAADEKTLAELTDNPAHFLARRHPGAAEQDLDLLALIRLAASDPEATAGLLETTWAHRLPLAATATAWAHVGKQAAQKQLPQAGNHAQRAWLLWDATALPGDTPQWTDDLLAWHVRAALRMTANDRDRWPLARRAIEAMSVTQQHDATWVYWKARATLALAPPGAEGDDARALAQAALESIAPQQGFYGTLATEDLGGRVRLPAAPVPPAAAEREAVRSRSGFGRSLQLIALGLRDEGVREWNYTLRGLGERELLAAAQWACEREVWDRCINTSERTRTEIQMAQRYPLVLREPIVARAQTLGLDPAVVFGLIRQESRFVPEIRSAAGAVGLMQLMPATARWTAKKIGLDYRPEMINDRSVNLQLGSSYFKRLLDDFDGSLAMAAAAYNAGPGRPRRWREGATMEPAAWAESIPFNETRDYVKKVLNNAVWYGVMLGQQAPTLKARLGASIGPRDPAAPAPDRELP
jgi:soluble lytic murein transglycosylase